MNLLFLIIFAVCVFAGVLVGYKKYFSTTLYALAIGGIVNANFFTSYFYPIDVFGLDFGIDAIIYSLFIFCVLLMYTRCGKKQAHLLCVSSVIAIVIAAIFEMFAKIFSGATEAATFIRFVTLLFSAVTTLISMCGCVELFAFIERKRKINEYIVIGGGMLINNIVSTGLYLGSVALISDLSQYDIPGLLLTNMYGKLISIGAALLILLIIRLIDKQIAKKNNKSGYIN